MLPKITRAGNCKTEIRQMEKLMRRANAQFPRISPYRVNLSAKRRMTDIRYINWIKRITSIVDSDRAMDSGKNFLDIVLDSTKALKKNRLGDCGESSSLIMSSLFANGYKDGTIAQLIFEAEARDLRTNELLSKRIFDTTHQFVVRNLNKNATSSEPKTYGKNLILIDAWDGFCSNFQEGLKRYFDTFLNGMRKYVNKDENIIITYKPKFLFLKCGKDVTDKDIAKFKKEFPELLI